MADQDNEKRLDQLLDSLLTTYSDVQPRPGLETRILATVRAQVPQSSRQWGIAWIWAGAVITTLALAAVLLVTEAVIEVVLPRDRLLGETVALLV